MTALRTLLTNSPCDAPKGAGMSTRPAYYSGRGAIIDDLNGSKLETLYQGIKAGEETGEYPEGASEAFVEMVIAMPELSATSFLKTLFRLEKNNWTWDPSLVDPSGVDLGSDGEDAGMMSFFTAFSATGSRRDETDNIRNPFLWKRGRPTPRKSRRDTYHSYEE